MKSTTFLLTIALCGLLLVSFVKKDNPIKKLPKEFQDQFGFVPSVNFILNYSDQDSHKFNLTRPSTVNTGNFYCAKSEVSNFQYRQFITELRRKNSQAAARVMIDSTQWKEDFAYNEPFVHHYHNHPAYDNYPVSNITHEGAQLYCKWLEEKLNASDDAEYQYIVRLPSAQEWVGAAKGGFDSSPYAWGGSSITNLKGCLLCNFRYLGPENIHFNSETETYEIVNFYNGKKCGMDNGSITLPVDSYSPNAYGLYNMNGNVAEMISEEGTAYGGGWKSPGFDVRCESSMSYSSPQTDVGFRPIIRIVEK